MSILNLNKGAKVALGIEKKDSDRNPLETFGFSWRVTLLGFDDEKLNTSIKSWAQKVVTKIHPDNTGRENTDEELILMGAFEQLKDRKVYDDHLNKFKEMRSEEAYYSRQIKKKSSDISRKSDLVQKELADTQESPQDAEEEIKFLRSRLSGFIRMQVVLDKPKDNRYEIVGGKSSQVEITNLNNVQQIVLCHFEAEFAPASSKESLDQYKTLKPKIKIWNKRLKELKVKKFGLERKHRNLVDLKSQIATNRDLNRVRNQISNFEIKLQRAKEYIILNNIGFLSLDDTIEELLKLEVNSTLPILRFDPSDLFPKMGLPFRFFDGIKNPYWFDYEPMLSKVERLERSSENLELLRESYYDAIKFYQTNSPAGMIVRRILIHPQVLPVESGILMVPVKRKTGDSELYRKVVGCIPTNRNLLSVKKAYDRKGQLIFSEEEILRNMLPCITRGSMLITMPVQNQNQRISTILRGDADSFFRNINESGDMQFISEGITIAVYT